MVILIVHSRYREPGGEDEVAAQEAALLRSKGHEVVELTESNDRLDDMSRLRAAARTLWSRESHARIRETIRARKPDIMHVHNFFPLLSPAIHHAARAEGVAVVQTLHNFRLVCPASTLMRDGKICEECVGRRLALPGVIHGCYRGDRAASATTASMLALHRAAGTWTGAVDLFIALAEFAREKFVAGGLPPEKIVVKPNFTVVQEEARKGRGEHALFMGRLTEEKGVRTLVEAWRGVDGLRLLIAGEGPARLELERAIANHDLAGSVELLGHRSREELTSLVRGARFVVVPSTWQEPFGLTAIEAFAQGVPVIASRIGALAEIVEDSVTGLHVPPGDSRELARAVRWATEHPGRLTEMGAAARRSYEARYTPDRNYGMLMEIYRRASGSALPAGARSRSSPRSRTRHGALTGGPPAC